MTCPRNTSGRTAETLHSSPTSVWLTPIKAGVMAIHRLQFQSASPTSHTNCYSLLGFLGAAKGAIPSALVNHITRINEPRSAHPAFLGRAHVTNAQFFFQGCDEIVAFQWMPIDKACFIHVVSSLSHPASVVPKKSMSRKTSLGDQGLTGENKKTISRNYSRFGA